MPSVLVIDDEPSYCSVMEVILQMEGFEVTTASSGPEAVAWLSHAIPDVILCDVLMWGMDGYSVLEAVKQDKRLSGVPFIFVTAVAETAEVQRGLSAGASDYLTKPFTADELVAAIESSTHGTLTPCTAPA